VGYVTGVATPKTSKKASNVGTLFVARCLNPWLIHYKAFTRKPFNETISIIAPQNLVTAQTAADWL